MKFVDSKSALSFPVVYATDRSNAVIPVLFLFCVALWFILLGTPCLVLPCSLSSCFFSPFSIVANSLGEEGACVWASRAIVCFARVNFVLFPLSIGVRGWLRLLIVAVLDVSVNYFGLLRHHKQPSIQLPMRTYCIYYLPYPKRKWSNYGFSLPRALIVCIQILMASNTVVIKTPSCKHAYPTTKSTFCVTNQSDSSNIF